MARRTKKNPVAITENNSVVDIEKVFPNEYNPKKTDPEFAGYVETIENLKKSLTTKGQVQPVKVREIDDGYELVDGFHTYVAMKELGSKHIEIKNLGKLSFEEAATLCLTVENIKNPIDPVEEASLIRTLHTEFNISLDDLSTMTPYKLPDLEFKVEMLEFDFASLNSTDETTGADEAASGHADNASAGLQTDGRPIFFGQDQYEIVNRVIAFAHDQQGDEASDSECVVWALLQVLEGTGF